MREGGGREQGAGRNDEGEKNAKAAGDRGRGEAARKTLPYTVGKSKIYSWFSPSLSFISSAFAEPCIRDTIHSVYLSVRTPRKTSFVYCNY